jgi:hypothetical protein
VFTFDGQSTGAQSRSARSFTQRRAVDHRHDRLHRARFAKDAERLGEIAWTIPAVNDVQNNVVARRRSRGQGRETPTVAARKQG